MKDARGFPVEKSALSTRSTRVRRRDLQGGYVTTVVGGDVRPEGPHGYFDNFMCRAFYILKALLAPP